MNRRSVVRLAPALPLVGVAAGTAACGTSAGTATPATPEPSELVALVASSLTDAFTELGEAFSGPPGAPPVRFSFNFGASSQLRTQMEQGAPADLFASADTVQMDAAVNAGLIQGTPRIFARNRLVVVVPKANRAGVNTLADLAKPGLKLVTTAREVPVGNYTVQALGKMAADPVYGPGFDRRALANVVSEEANVRQVVTKVQLGEADAGVVYASDVTPRVAPDLMVLDIPEKFNTMAEYPIAVAKRAKAPVSARRFVEYVLSPAGQLVLRRNGFIPLA